MAPRPKTSYIPRPKSAASSSLSGASSPRPKSAASSSLPGTRARGGGPKPGPRPRTADRRGGGSASLEEIQDLFEHLDKSGDTLLSFNELSTFLITMHPELTRREIYLLFQQLDQNADGKIDLKEFVDYLFKPDSSDASGGGGSGAKDGSATASRLKTQVPEGLDYTDLQTGRGCAIPDTERRAMTVAQLRAVLRHVQRRCEPERWSDINPSSPTFGTALKFAGLNLYHVNDWIVKPSTAAAQCSFVEFVASAEQPPCWFVSHFWGEPHPELIKCIEQHMTDRALTDLTSYWICAYANNQWDLQTDVTADPAKSSFRKAIDLAVGTLSILDKPGMCYTRVWCCYEVYVTLVIGQDETDVVEDKLYDVYTAVGRRAVGITDGLVAADLVNGEELSALMKSQRESIFPASLVKGSLRMQLERGQASVESDRRHILNSMVGAKDLDAEPVEEHVCYTEANGVLRGRFAAAAWRLAVESGQDLADYAAALASSKLEKLTLSLNGLQEKADNACFTALGASLPGSMKDLSLDFTGCLQFGDFAMGRIAEGLKRAWSLGFKRLHLHFAHCGNLTNSACAQLASVFVGDSVHSLQDCSLDFSGVWKLEDEALHTLAESLAAQQSLRNLRLDFQGCRKITSAGASSLLSATRPQDLRSLDLRVSGCPQITDAVLCATAMAVSQAKQLKRLSLRCDACKLLSPAGLRELLEQLPASLADLELGFAHCPSLVDKGRNWQSITEARLGHAKVRIFH